MESPKSSNKINISKSDVTWSYIAQFFNVGAQVLILPMVLRILSPDMYGVWSLFIAIGGFVILLDFGFQTIFTRSVSYAFSGITVLLKEGIDPDAPVMNEPNYRLLKSLIKYMRRFYGLMSLFMLLILATAGTYYIYTVSSHLDNWGEILLAWGIFVFSTVFGFCFLYFRPLFLGRGLLKENNILIIVNKSVYIICAIIGLKLGYGIVAIPLALGLGEVVNRICAYFVFNRGGMKNILKETQSYEKKSTLLSGIMLRGWE